MGYRAALVVDHNKPIEFVEYTLRDPGPKEVLVHLDYAPVCITDAYAWRGATKPSRWPGGTTRSVPPFVTGHAGTGIVLEAGVGVTRVAVGDRVAIVGTNECGECYYCANNTPGACAEVFEQGVRIIGQTTDGRDLKLEGGIGTYLTHNIYREGTVVKLSPHVDPARAALFGCGIPSGIGAVLTVGQVTAGSSVAVSGAGHLGLWMVQGAKVAGASQIIVVEPIAERRALALQIGATDVVDPADGDPVEQVRALTDGNRGTDFSFEAVGSPEAMTQAVRIVRNGGITVPTGLQSRDDEVTLNVVDFAIYAKQVRSSQTGGGWIHRDIPRWEKLLLQGRIDPEPIISGIFPLDQLEEIFRRSLNREVITAVMDLRAR